MKIFFKHNNKGNKKNLKASREKNYIRNLNPLEIFFIKE